MLLLLSLLTVVIINVALFIVAYKRQSDKLTDFSYALSFIVVAVSALIMSEYRSALLILTVGMVVVWGVRLGGFLVYRIRKTGRDSRFDAIRGSFFKFLKFWLGQAIVAWFLLLPLLFLAGREGELSALTFIGVIVWIVGLTIESFTDLQKYSFTQKASNKNKWIDEGLWHYSRHPNYFGEMCIWVGVYLTVFSSLSDLERWIGLMSPVVIIVTLRFISGVPILEKSADKKWGKDAPYQMYKERTNLIIPFWPKKRYNKEK